MLPDRFIKFYDPILSCDKNITRNLAYKKIADLILEEIFIAYVVKKKHSFSKILVRVRQSYNLLFEKFLLGNFTRSILMSDEFKVMNSLDDLIHVRIDHWKFFLGMF